MKRALDLGAVSLILLLAIALVGCSPAEDKGVSNGAPSERPGDQVISPAAQADVTLTTSDGIDIAGTFVEGTGDGPRAACLLVHMLGQDRGTYEDFQESLAQVGISSLAIDMRGHGDSTANNTLNFRQFSQEEWAEAANDFIAGMEYLRSHPNVDAGRLGIVGASIAANLAVVAAADDISSGVRNPAKCLVLLSPGIGYHGIAPLPRARELEQTPVLIFSATDDRQSYSGSQSLSQAARNAELESVAGNAHGTDLFEVEDTAGRLVEWLVARLRP